MELLHFRAGARGRAEACVLPRGEPGPLRDQRDGELATLMLSGAIARS